jgi:pyruvate kinase
MSHGSHPEHQQALDTIRELVDERGVHVAVMADLCGPKVRTGKINPSQAELMPGAECVIRRRLELGTAADFSTNYPGLVDDVDVGHRVLIEDGKLRLRVSEKQQDAIVCACEVGGELGSRKGLNLPDSNLSIPAITEKDKADLKWAVGNAVDFIAQSFVRRSEDIIGIRRSIEAAGGDIPIVAKIETTHAIADLEGLLRTADAALVARGDLGVEMDVWRVPMVQKDIVRQCRRLGRPVIVATQMLQSMVNQPTPTRAEVSDAANAILDGADALMLSAESAVGEYPVESVRMLNRIALQIDGERSTVGADPGRVSVAGTWIGQHDDRTAAAVAHSAVLIALELDVKLLAVWCRSGRTARWISKYQIPKTLIALSSNDVLCRQLALCAGLEPRLVPKDFESGAIPSRQLYEHVSESLGLDPGDMVVVVGEPTAPQRASTISIHTVSRRDD